MSAVLSNVPTALGYVVGIGFIIWGAHWIATLGRSKGYSYWLFFVAGVVLTPAFTGIVLFFMPDHGVKRTVDLDDLTRRHQSGEMSDEEFVARAAARP
jgi:hypothetical protein